MGVIAAAVLAATCTLAGSTGSGLASPESSSPAVVLASAETAPVPHTGDAADDAAIWIDERRPARSLVIGTDKQGGLGVYDLAGRALQFYADSKPNNVDLRHGFPLAGSRVALVATSDRVGDTIRVYVVDPVSRRLRYVAHRALETGIGVYGLCMYRSRTGAYYVFVGDNSGTVQQWQLIPTGHAVDARKVRTLRFGSTTEGCVADDASGRLYVAEEAVGVWRYGAEPGAGSTRNLVDSVQGGRLTADVEGLAVVAGGAGKGYLLVSSQGSDIFAVYRRSGDNGYVGSFRIGDGRIDGVTHTDGIEATGRSLGPAFPRGVFVAQDDQQPGGNQNFKLVPWDRIGRALSLTPVKPRSAVDPPGDGGPATYFVDSRAGDDSSAGTAPTAAWRTLGRAATARLASGDRLLLARGATWREPLVLRSSGTARAPVVVGAYGRGPEPVIERSPSCVVVQGSYVSVRDLHVRDCDWAGVEVGGRGDRVESCVVEGSAAGVYVRAEALETTIVRNTIRDNARMSVLTRDASDDDSGAFGILVQGRATEIARNMISGSDAFSYDYGRDGAALEIYGASGTYVHHNRAMDNDAFAELGNRASDTRIVYNVVTSSLPTSIFLVTRGAGSRYGPVLDTVLYQNSVSLVGASSKGVVCHDGCGPGVLKMRNNVVVAASPGFADARFDEDFDLFVSKPAFPTGPNTVVADPAFRDRARDLRLRSGSPAVDRGVAGLGQSADVDGRPVPLDGDGDGRARPDIGAYERSQSG